MKKTIIGGRRLSLRVVSDGSAHKWTLRRKGDQIAEGRHYGTLDRAIDLVLEPMGLRAHKGAIVPR